MADLLATLRPFGAQAVVGDQNDGTFSEYTGVLALGDAFRFGFWPITDFDEASGLPEYVVVRARVSWEHSDQGPVDPEFWLWWNDPISGDQEVAGPFTTAMGLLTLTTISSGSLLLDPGGNAWINGVLDAMELKVEVTGDDQATQVATTFRVQEMWAEVWGAPAGLSNPETLTVAADGDEAVTARADGDIALTLACGDPGTVVKCDGDLALTVACDIDEEE